MWRRQRVARHRYWLRSVVLTRKTTSSFVSDDKGVKVEKEPFTSRVWVTNIVMAYAMVKGTWRALKFAIKEAFK